MIGPAEWTHVEIVTGILSGPTRSESGKVVELDYRHIGRRVFIVDMIEPDGGRLCVFESFDYAQAILEAEEVADDHGIVVRDLVVGKID